jgi:hypothetical protein
MFDERLSAFESQLMRKVRNIASGIELLPNTQTFSIETVCAAESSCARQRYDIVFEGGGERCARVEENRGALKRQHGAFGPPRSSRVDRMIRSRSARVVRLSLVRDEHEHERFFAGIDHQAIIQPE